MLYAIIGTDKPDSQHLRSSVRADHLARIEVLHKQGRLKLAGPFPAIDAEDPGQAGFTGSLIVAEFNSLEEAETWIKSDPYVVNGVYESVSVKPYKHVLPNI